MHLPRTGRRRIVPYPPMHKNLRSATASQTINAQWYSGQWIVAKSQKHNHEPSHTYYDKVVTRKTPEDSLRNILEELNPQKAIAEPKYLETEKP